MPAAKLQRAADMQKLAASRQEFGPATLLLQ